MNYQQALPWAENIKETLSQYCERIEIAGSVRRKKQADIKDIEIVCVPKVQLVTDLFGEETGSTSLLQEAFPSLCRSWHVQHVVRNGPSWKTFFIYDQSVSDEGVKVDLFIVTRETWGTQFTLKTGPAEYSKWIVTEKRFGGAMPGHAKFTGSFNIEIHGEPVPMYEEKDFFEFLSLPFVEPWERKIPIRSIA